MPKQLTLPAPWKRRLYLPTYAVKDAARLAKANSRTVSYWHFRGGSLGPALPGRVRRQPLSYLQLIEVAFVSTFRNFGVSLQRIRKARDYFGQRFDTEYPFAELRLKTDGHHVLMDMLEVEPDGELNRLIVGDAHGQLAWEKLVADRFAEFDYENDLTVVWHVAGRSSQIKIDPRIVFGTPNINGVPTRSLRGRSLAGEQVADIAEDFGLDETDVKQALAFEGVQLAA